MKKKEKDSRINAKYISIREYAIFLFVLAAFNGFHMWIYQEMEKNNIFETNVRLGIVILMSYVMLMAVLATVIIGLLRDRSLMLPMIKLSEAARDISKGNFNVRIAPLRKDGKKDFVDVMFEDFNTMVKELGSIETLKNDFIANVSHEIKTPLSVIQSYTTALQNNSLQENERMEYTHIILEATKKLSLLVTNILKLNKLENQEIISESKPYNLTEQLRQCVLSFLDLMEAKNINFEEELDELFVCYDKEMLEIVWNNLLSNAVKFTNSGGSIYILLQLQSDNNQKFAKVSISDTGCGMDEDTQKNIFNKFYQGDTSHSKNGNGLGLALVKKTIDLLGGTITVDSMPGQGSMFTVYLKNTI
jgi:signal transduction histidine kinase